VLLTIPPPAPCSTFVGAGVGYKTGFGEGVEAVSFNVGSIQNRAPFFLISIPGRSCGHHQESVHTGSVTCGVVILNKVDPTGAADGVHFITVSTVVSSSLSAVAEPELVEAPARRLLIIVGANSPPVHWIRSNSTLRPPADACVIMESQTSVGASVVTLPRLNKKVADLLSVTWTLTSYAVLGDKFRIVYDGTDGDIAGKDTQIVSTVRLYWTVAAVALKPSASWIVLIPFTSIELVGLVDDFIAVLGALSFFYVRFMDRMVGNIVSVVFGFQP
jgi:hypothetical protein